MKTLRAEVVAWGDSTDIFLSAAPRLPISTIVDPGVGRERHSKPR
jgi:hypothetical protein